MKKLIVFILSLAMMLSMVGCQYLPEDAQSKLEEIKTGVVDSITGIIDTLRGDDTHEHNYVVTSRVDPTCEKDGLEKVICNICAEKSERVVPALGHSMRDGGRKEPTCVLDGAQYTMCALCGKVEQEPIEKLGHHLADVEEPSRLVPCTRDGCGLFFPMFPETGKYTEYLVFSFGDEEKAELDAKHNQLLSILNSAEKYDPAKHAYAESGELADSYAAAEKVYEEYSDLIFAAQGQYSIAMTLYYCDMDNKALEETYNGMQTYYTELVANFYSLSEPWYESMYREFFFYGATEEEIKAFLFESNAYANPEYAELKNRNDSIELEFLAMADPTINDNVLVLYEEFVANGNRMAQILGYDNYLEYAYENVYGREYTYQDISIFTQYVREYIVPIYNSIFAKWNYLASVGQYQTDIDTYYSVVANDFFSDYSANRMFNNYLDETGIGFTSNPDKTYSFSDELNGLVSNGNLFRGVYEGAYVSYIIDGGFPIAYFGEGYNNTTTVAHEFGHFMNGIYNGEEYSQSFDLLETHSQGNEMLYIYYIKGEVNKRAFDLIETYQLLNMLYTVINAVQVDCFEQAVYLNQYDGPNSEVIMADGKITADEYDLLYASISEWLGIEEDYRQDEYWRYVTISSPCYYISYSISGINALQLYSHIYNTDYDTAMDSYLKLITYTDIDPEMTYEEVLLYAGLKSYNDEQTYISIGEFFEARNN